MTLSNAATELCVAQFIYLFIFNLKYQIMGILKSTFKASMYSNITAVSSSQVAFSFWQTHMIFS